MDECITGQLVLGVGQAEYSKIVVDMEEDYEPEFPESRYDFSEKEKDALHKLHLRIKYEEKNFFDLPDVQSCYDFIDGKGC